MCDDHYPIDTGRSVWTLPTFVFGVAGVLDVLARQTLDALQVVVSR